MKTLSNYIKESVGNSQNGHFEEFVDEETGDLTTMWVDNDFIFLYNFYIKINLNF